MAPRRLIDRPARVAGAAILVACATLAPLGGEPQDRLPSTAPSDGESRPAPRIEILPPSPRPSGRLRVETLVTSSEIRRVEFLLDGELVDEDRRFPFTTTLDEPLYRGRERLEAVGLSRRGTELARDVVVLAPAGDRLAVEIAAIRPLASRGWMEVTADVRLPPGSTLDRLDFYRGPRYVGSVQSLPHRLRIPRCERAGYLRAVALTRDGRMAESVRLMDDAGVADALSVSLVEIYAMVSDRKGRPVEGLARSAFELLHDGTPRPIERFAEGDEVPLSLALVIDSSGSMYASMDRAKRSARRFLAEVLDPGDRALLVDFDHHPRLLVEATGEVDRLITHFDAIESDGASAVYDGIAFALLELERAAGRKALVVITDGRDSGSRLNATECARLARRSGVPIFVLRHDRDSGLLPSHHRLTLARLADETGGTLTDVRSGTQLDAAYTAIERQLRGQYLLAFEADATLSTSELEALTVRVADERLRVRTILGGRVRLED